MYFFYVQERRGKFIFDFVIDCDDMEGLVVDGVVVCFFVLFFQIDIVQYVFIDGNLCNMVFLVFEWEFLFVVKFSKSIWIGDSKMCMFGFEFFGEVLLGGCCCIWVVFDFQVFKIDDVLVSYGVGGWCSELKLNFLSLSGVGELCK